MFCADVLNSYIINWQHLEMGFYQLYSHGYCRLLSSYMENAAAASKHFPTAQLVMLLCPLVLALNLFRLSIWENHLETYSSYSYTYCLHATSHCLRTDIQINQDDKISNTIYAWERRSAVTVLYSYKLAQKLGVT